MREQFVCEALPTRTVHGFVTPAEIPPSIVPGEKKLDIVGELEADWMCDFFLRQSEGASVGFVGSCLVPSVPLGCVGELDIANEGAFEITIPDFARDPLFKGSAEGSDGVFGTIILAIRDKKVGRTLGAITVVSAPGSGLRVESDYADPIAFAIVR